MTKVSVSKKINVSAEKAWEKIAAFSGIEDYSPIVKSTVIGIGVGAKRHCIMPDNTEIREELESLNHNIMELRYSILSSPFPIKNYKGLMQVKSLGEQLSEVSWSSEFELNGASESDVKPVFEGFYNASISSLEDLLK
ncbi:MAG: SRPBCC family protein [Cyclobacteriaceae bacterium]